VIGFIVASCAAIRRSGDAGLTPRQRDFQMAGAAVLAVIGFFFWPSAIYLVPLLAAELLDVHARHFTFTKGGHLVVAGVAGAFVGVTACLLPFGSRVPSFLADVFTSTDQYYRSGSYVEMLPSAFQGLVSSYRLSPWLPLMALACAARSRLMALAMALTLAAMVPTAIYPHRVVYLLPFIIAMIGDATGAWPGGAGQRTLRWTATAALAWAAGISLVARPVQALMFNDARGHHQYERAADSVPELSGKRIYLNSWDFYYAGRERQWRMMHGYGDIGVEGWAKTFANVDYAIYQESDTAARRNLERDGWPLLRELVLPPVSGPPFTVAPAPRRYFIYAAPR
jgi:hypothetical protein